MKRIIYILLPVMTALNVCGCNRFLDREQESFIDLDKTYTSYERTVRPWSMFTASFLTD